MGHEPILGKALVNYMEARKATKFSGKGEIPFRVYQTIEGLYPGDLKPLIREFDHNKNDEHTWWFVIHLPGTITYEQFKDKEKYFAAVKCSAHIQPNGKFSVKLIVSDFELPLKIPYKLNPGQYSNLFLPILYGLSNSGPVVEDAATYPHIFVSGDTGGGKTTFILNYVYTQLICGRVNPCSKSLIFVLDYKEVDFREFADYCVVTADIESSRTILYSIEQERERRKDVLAQYHTHHWDVVIKENPDLPWIILVIDELGLMQDKTSQKLLGILASQGRASGIRIIAGTQRPSMDLWSGPYKFKDVLQHFEKRLAFPVPDMDSSYVALGRGNGQAATLEDIKGRAILKRGREFTRVQTLYFPDPSRDKAEFNKLMASLNQAGVPNVGREVYDYFHGQNEQLSKVRLPRQTNYQLPGGSRTSFEPTDLFPHL